jgi:hypothetical protein
MGVYLSASARFQNFAWLGQIPCNYRFLGGIIQTRDVMSWWGSWPFQLNSCKNFKKRVQKLVSKRRVDSVKEGVNGYIAPRTSSEWHVIENAWQNTYMPEKLIQEWRWTVDHIVMEFCILFWDNISSFNETCLVFVSLLFWNQQMFNILFW